MVGRAERAHLLTLKTLIEHSEKEVFTKKELLQLLNSDITKSATIIGLRKKWCAN